MFGDATEISKTYNENVCVDIAFVPDEFGCISFDGGRIIAENT